MSDIAIRVENLSKAYRIGLKEEMPDSLVGAATGLLKAPWRNFQRLRRLNTFGQPVESPESRVESQNSNGDTTHKDTAGPADPSIPNSEFRNPNSDLFWALRDVSFDVKRGEVVGIIGRNGAGKSTLLKLLSRITEPTSGRAVIHGRVGSLLEVGTGFHPELTGRENVYMNGTILGMTKREIDRKFDEIVDFSGVERFLDTPVKRYSSGMQVRLAFAVAAHLDPEILIVDEVLAVGDATFQHRCLTRMRQVAKSGATVLLVSHNMDVIPRIATRCILLDSGMIERTGAPTSLVDHYIASQSLCTPVAHTDSDAIFEKVQLVAEDGSPLATHIYGQDLRLRVDIRARRPVTDAAIALTVCSLSAARLISSWTRECNYVTSLEQGPNTYECTFSTPTLRPSHEFSVMLWMDCHGQQQLVENALRFTVLPSDAPSRALSGNRHQGSIVVPTRWSKHRLTVAENSAR